MRISDTGVRDPSFGTNGVVTTRFTGSITNLGRRFWLEPDGHITMIGTAVFGAAQQCGVARFDANGVPDSGFGTSGLTLVDMNSACFTITQQADGKFVITGNDQVGDVQYASFARLLLNGTPDSSFGTNGILRISSFSSPTRVLPLSSGAIATGYTIEDPADGIQKSYVVELASTLAGPYLPQTINFASLADRQFGDVFQASATASSGLPVSFTASGVCSVDGNVVQLSGIGNCSITAHQTGNATWLAATSVSRTFAVNFANQAIAFGPAPTGATAEQLLVTFTATSSSPRGGAIGHPDRVQLADAVGVHHARLLRLVGESRRCRHVHDCGEPGGQCLLQSRAAGNAQLRGRGGASRHRRLSSSPTTTTAAREACATRSLRPTRRRVSMPYRSSE
jgi:hypothetical protein